MSKWSLWLFAREMQREKDFAQLSSSAMAKNAAGMGGTHPFLWASSDFMNESPFISATRANDQ